jgi:hypothetical protein
MFLAPDEHYCNVGVWQRKTTIIGEKSLPHWHFVHNRSHMDYTTTESRPPHVPQYHFIHCRSPLTRPGLNPGLYFCPHCNFIHSRSHMDYPRIESRFLQ